MGNLCARIGASPNAVRGEEDQERRTEAGNWSTPKPQTTDESNKQQQQQQQGVMAAADGQQPRRRVRIASEDANAAGGIHSRSAPHLATQDVKRSRTTYSISDDREVAEEEFQQMLRQFTRKSMSMEGDEEEEELSTAAPAPVAATTVRRPTRSSTTAPSHRRGPRRNSNIDDRDVLRLLATRSRLPKEYDQLSQKAAAAEEDLDLKQLPVDVQERVHRRRQTMEKLDIFSPDAAPERLEELYDATEKFLAAQQQD